MLENYRVQVFRAVAEQASFRRAAEQLHLSQPSVSQHVQLLEEELGVRLLDRSEAGGSGGIQITPAGELLLDFARRSSRLSQQVLKSLAKLEGQPAGTLKLAASTTVAQYLLPRVLGNFLKANPRIRMTVKSGNTEQVAAWVLSGEAELGLVEGPPKSKELAVEHFMHDQLSLIVPPQPSLGRPADDGCGARRHSTPDARAGLRNAACNGAGPAQSRAALEPVDHCHGARLN